MGTYLDTCPVCGSTELRSLRTYRNRGRSISGVAALELVGCERCGVAFSHPLPSPAEVDSYYAVEGWDRVSGRAPEKLERRREGKLSRHALEFDLLAERVPALRPSSGGPPLKALDFGCGTGEWLDVLAERGFEAYGIEPARSARDVAAERHVILDELPGSETFDLVMLNHVVEHLLDPVATLDAVAAAMRPGGHLFVSVPSLAGLPEHGKLNYAASGVHIFSYTPAGLQSVLALAGFEQPAHLDGPEWEQASRHPGARLKMLARKASGVQPLPSGRPLAQAAEALAAYDRRRGAAEDGHGRRPPRATTSACEPRADPPSGASAARARGSGPKR